MARLLSRALEEIFPFILYCINKNKLLKMVHDKEKLNEDISRYKALSNDCLKTRIQEEHDRAKLIDEKTNKFTLIFTVLIGLLKISIINPMDIIEKSSLLIFFFVATYIMFVVLMSLGAFATLPTYGYGTDFLLKIKDDNENYCRAEALVQQEKINIIRHDRNEATFQCLRNSVICSFVFLIIYFLNSFC